MYVLQSEETRLKQELEASSLADDIATLAASITEIKARMSNLESKVQSGNLTQDRYIQAIMAMQKKMRQMSLDMESGPQSRLASRWLQIITREIEESTAESTAPPPPPPIVSFPMALNTVPCISVLKSEKERIATAMASQGIHASHALATQKNDVDARIADLESKVQRGLLTSERYIEAISAMRLRMIQEKETDATAAKWLTIIEEELSECGVSPSTVPARAERPAVSAAKSVVGEHARLVSQAMKQDPMPGSASGQPGPHGVDSGGDIDSETFDALWDELNNDSSPLPRQAVPVPAPSAARKQPAVVLKPAVSQTDARILEALAPVKPKEVSKDDIEALIAQAASEMGPETAQEMSDFEKKILGQNKQLDDDMAKQMAQLDAQLGKFG